MNIYINFIYDKEADTTRLIIISFNHSIVSAMYIIYQNTSGWDWSIRVAPSISSRSIDKKLKIWMNKMSRRSWSGGAKKKRGRRRAGGGLRMRHRVYAPVWRQPERRRSIDCRSERGTDSVLQYTPSKTCWSCAEPIYRVVADPARLRCKAFQTSWGCKNVL